MPTQEIVGNITLKTPNKSKSEEWSDIGHPKETWLSINGYENLYEISDYGRVKSFPRLIKNSIRSYISKTKILKPKNHQNRYLAVCLYKNGKSEDFRIHRLVALHFIPNPNNLPSVHHKDKNGKNNNVENLEWVNQKQNLNYAFSHIPKKRKTVPIFEASEEFDMNIEIWKDIAGYEGIYQISTLGNIKSLQRYIKSNNRTRLLKEKILNGSNSHDYLRVELRDKNGNKRGYAIHRLVAVAFLKNSNRLPIINHKDSNPLNNHVNNLEWCNNKHNVEHYWKSEHVNTEYCSGENNYYSKLTNKDIIEIRKLSKKKNIYLKGLAKKYNITYGHLYKIIHDKVWKHLS